MRAKSLAPRVPSRWRNLSILRLAMRGTSGGLRRPRRSRYRCSLPGLAGFAGPCRTEPEAPLSGSRTRSAPLRCKSLAQARDVTCLGRRILAVAPRGAVEIPRVKPKSPVRDCRDGLFKGRRICVQRVNIFRKRGISGPPNPGTLDSDGVAPPSARVTPQRDAGSAAPAARIAASPQCPPTTRGLSPLLPSAQEDYP